MVSSDGYAVICKETGEILYKSDYGDEDEIPEEVYDREDCIEIPHKNDLDLGRTSSLNLLSNIYRAILSESDRYSEEEEHTQDTKI